MVFDTDILVWILRGNLKAGRMIDASEDPAVSVVTYMELIGGAHDRAEIRSIKDVLAGHGFAVFPLDEKVGHRAAIYLEEYRLKSGLGLADALVAATAVENAAILCTGNARHFRAIADLEVKAFRP